jgi:hypothetical protein
MTIAVITSLSGLGTATIRDPDVAFANVEYHAFTNKHFPVQTWRLHALPEFSTDREYSDRRNAKLAKALAWLLLPGYDYYVWHDAHCEVKIDPHYLVSQYLTNHDIAVFRHPERDCSYAELQVLAERNLDTGENLMNTLNFLQTQSWPLNQGLYELSSFVYRPSESVRKLMLTWWELISKYTSRDQVLFPYSCKLHQVECAVLPGAALPYGGSNQFFPSQRWKTT